MANPETLVAECVEALKVILQATPLLKDKVLFVTDEDDLMTQLKGVIALPAAGVIYEGLKSKESQGETAKFGLSADMVLTVVVANRGIAIRASEETKITSIAILDQIRNAIMATRSPTGHFWRFVVEAAAAQHDGVVFWVQRWSTPVQLAPQPARPSN
jgi:hypothetical protein